MPGRVSSAALATRANAVAVENSVDYWSVVNWDGGTTWDGELGNFSFTMDTTYAKKLNHIGQNPSEAVFPGDWFWLPGETTEYLWTANPGNPVNPIITFDLDTTDLPAATGTTHSMSEVAANMGWTLQYMSNGKLRFQNYPTGDSTSPVQTDTTVALSAMGIPGWGTDVVRLRVLFLYSNGGKRKLYISYVDADNMSHQVDLNDTNASTSSFATTAGFAIGVHSGAASPGFTPFAGGLGYTKLESFNGFTTTTLLELDPATWTVANDHQSITDANAVTWTVFHSAGNKNYQVAIVTESIGVCSGTGIAGSIADDSLLDVGSYLEVFYRARTFDSASTDGVFVCKSPTAAGWNLGVYLTPSYASIAPYPEPASPVVTASTGQSPSSNMMWWSAQMDASAGTVAVQNSDGDSGTADNGSGIDADGTEPMTIGANSGGFGYAHEFTHLLLSHDVHSGSQREIIRDFLQSIVA